MKEKLALVNCAVDEMMFRKGCSTLTLSYLQDALKEEYDTVILPSKQYHRNEFRKMVEEVIRDIKDNDLIGLSTNTYSKPYADEMLDQIKKEYPSKKVYLGGQGIKELHPGIRVPKETVCPIAVTLEADQSQVDAEVLLTNLCPQNCGYCNTPKNQIPVPVDSYISRLDNLRAGKKIRRLTLYDNNPLHPLNFDRTCEFFIRLEKVLGYRPDSVFYCDPALLTDKAGFDRVISFMQGFRGLNSNMFFGRERPDEAISARIKRRVNGVQRTQGQLDLERKAMLNMASMLALPGKKGLNFTLVLNYILTPFETRESINAILSEVKEFSVFRRVIIKSNFLWVFPFTETASDYRGNYVEADKLGLKLKFYNYDSINYWKPGFENSRFLDLCNALNCRVYFQLPNEFYSRYNLSMIRLARDIILGEYSEKKTIAGIIEELPQDLQKMLGSRFLRFGAELEKIGLQKITDENLRKLLILSNTIFFNIPQELVENMADEYKAILDARLRLC